MVNLPADRMVSGRRIKPHLLSGALFCDTGVGAHRTLSFSPDGHPTRKRHAQAQMRRLLAIHTSPGWISPTQPDRPRTSIRTAARIPTSTLLRPASADFGFFSCPCACSQRKPFHRSDLCHFSNGVDWPSTPARKSIRASNGARPGRPSVTSRNACALPRRSPVARTIDGCAASGDLT